MTLALACDADSVCDSTYDGFRGAAGYSVRVGEAANPGPASDDVGTDDEVEPPVWPTERLTRFLDECELGLHAHALSEADASANPEGGDMDIDGTVAGSRADHPTPATPTDCATAAACSGLDDHGADDALDDGPHGLEDDPWGDGPPVWTTPACDEFEAEAAHLEEDIGTYADAELCDFYSAPRFAGARAGFAFKTGDHGTGYYRDGGCPLRAWQAALAAACPAPRPQCPPTAAVARPTPQSADGGLPASHPRVSSADQGGDACGGAPLARDAARARIPLALDVLIPRTPPTTPGPVGGDPQAVTTAAADAGADSGDEPPPLTSDESDAEPRPCARGGPQRIRGQQWRQPRATPHRRRVRPGRRGRNAQLAAGTCNLPDVDDATAPPAPPSGTPPSPHAAAEPATHARDDGQWRRTCTSTEATTHRQRGLWAVDTVNANAWKGARRYLELTAADVCLHQEVKRRRGQQADEAEDTAASLGWSTSIEPSLITTAGALSAGVAVSVRSHLGIARSKHALDDPVLAHRLVVRWVGSICRGGVHMASMYLWTKEGLSERNLDLLQAAARYLRGLSGPWCMAADFNCAPAELARSGWPALAGGVIVAPDMPTCHGRVLDFFVVSQDLVAAVDSVAVIEDAGYTPHSPVRLLLRAAPRAIRVRRLAAPRPFGAVLPHGCLSKSAAEAAVAHSAAPAGPAGPSSAAAATDGDARDTAQDTTAAEWISQAEQQLADICGLDGHDRQAHMGRAWGPRFRWVPALGKLGAAVRYSTTESRAWRSLAAWTAQVRRAMDARAQGTPSAAGMAIQAEAAKARIRALARRPMPDALQSTWFRQAVDALAPDVMCDAEAVRAIEIAVTAQAEAVERAAEAAAEKRWKAWLGEGAAGGLRHQHRFTRTPTGWTPTRVGAPPVPLNENGDIDDVDGLSTPDLRRLIATAGVVVAPLNRQENVEAEANDWAAHWAEGQVMPQQCWPVDADQHLPAPTPAQLRAALMSFPCATGLGWDGLHPRALTRLSDAMLMRFIDILMEAERRGRWPSVVGTVIIVLLPKAEGGFRPIGLFPTVVRVWMRLRRAAARQWEADNDRDYLYAGESRGALTAAWQMAARAEGAVGHGFVYAQVLLDMVKAFDHVPHDRLLAEAAALGYPMPLLRLALAAYRLPRVMNIGGVVSRTVMAARGLTAGSGTATTELRLLLIRIVDRVRVANPRVGIKVYVDDVTLEVVSTARRVARLLSDAGLQLCDALDGEIRMKLSPTKSLCSASDPTVGKQVAAAMARFHVHYCARVKALGVGLGAGRRRNVKVLNARLAAFRLRTPRLRRLARARQSAARVVRTGAAAAMDYGISVTGVSPTALRQRRRAVATAVGTGGAGGELNLSLIVADLTPKQRVDPAFQAHAAPIAAWAEAAWEKWVPHKQMRALMGKATLRLTKARRVWAAVCGPAAATLASAARLGWTVSDAFSFTTDRGRVLDLLQDPPCEVRREVHAAVERWRWRLADRHLAGLDANGDGSGALIGPVRKLLRPAALACDWTRGYQSALRSVLTGRQWPQARLYAAGLADHPSCQKCTAEGRLADPNAVGAAPSPPAGTLWHRVCDCAPNAEQRADAHPHLAHSDSRLSAAARSARDAAATAGSNPPTAHAASTKWTRALAPAPQVLCGPLPSPPDDGTFVWCVRPAGDMVRARFYTDGSMVDGPTAPLARLGWAFAAYDDDGQLVASAFGATPSWIHSIGGAEAWAILMAARAAEPGSTFRTDSLGCKDTLAAGRRWATAPARPQARVWKMLFVRFDGPEDHLDLLWMPSHASKGDVGVAELSDGSKLTALDLDGNATADTLAKRGAAQFRVPLDKRQTVARAEHEAEELARFVARVTWTANNFAQQPTRDSAPPQRARRDACGDEGLRVRAARRRGRQVLGARPVALGGHDLCRSSAGRWYCRVCRTSAASWGRIATARCPGSAAAKWAERAAALGAANSADAPSHRRFMTGGIIWCDACGSYAESFAVGLARPCPQGPRNDGKAQHLRRLRQGLHPATGLVLQDSHVAEPTSGARLAPSPAGQSPACPQTWGSGGRPAARGLTTTRRPAPCHGASHGVHARPLLARARRQPVATRLACSRPAAPRSKVRAGGRPAAAARAATTSPSAVGTSAPSGAGRRNVRPRIESPHFPLPAPPSCEPCPRAADAASAAAHRIASLRERVRARAASREPATDTTGGRDESLRSDAGPRPLDVEVGTAVTPTGGADGAPRPRALRDHDDEPPHKRPRTAAPPERTTDGPAEPLVGSRAQLLERLGRLGARPRGPARDAAAPPPEGAGSPRDKRRRLTVAASVTSADDTAGRAASAAVGAPRSLPVVAVAATALPTVQSRTELIAQLSGAARSAPSSCSGDGRPTSDEAAARARRRAALPDRVRASPSGHAPTALAARPPSVPALSPPTRAPRVQLADDGVT